MLARDRMGIKPLYIARRGEELLLRLGAEGHSDPSRDRAPSEPAGSDCYLSLNYIPAPWTLVEGIEKLLPGTWLEWRNGEVRTEAYWTLA